MHNNGKEGWRIPCEHCGEGHNRRHEAERCRLKHEVKYLIFILTKKTELSLGFQKKKVLKKFLFHFFQVSIKNLQTNIFRLLGWILVEYNSFFRKSVENCKVLKFWMFITCLTVFEFVFMIQFIYIVCDFEVHKGNKISLSLKVCLTRVSFNRKYVIIEHSNVVFCYNFDEFEG